MTQKAGRGNHQSLKIETAKKKQVRCRSKSKISIITLNVNSLKMPTKRERLSK